ncbi:hypothetical protein [Acinetobacter beijerinckii]|uniref:hypothetical protein n=1 Tax=Acinetobacter beijerinckii TaxID=262668 RepID=UPI0040553149
MLRKLGDFPNRNTVEYATLLVHIKNNLLPQNLRSYHWEHDENSTIIVGVSSTGRLCKKSVYLDSLELAEDFAVYLHELFKKRKYNSDYRIELLVDTTSSGKTVSRWKEIDSQNVRDLLSL